jgi:hypothetical protein
MKLSACCGVIRLGRLNFEQKIAFYAHDPSVMRQSIDPVWVAGRSYIDVLS